MTKQRTWLDEMEDIMWRWWCLEDERPYGFEYFIEEALGVDGTRMSGGRMVAMSTQQREAAREISKLVRAKIKLKNDIALNEEEKAYSEKVGFSIMSGQGTGKDALLAWLKLYLLSCFDDVLIPCTAPGADQLKNILWPEVSRWLTKKDDKGEFFVVPHVRENIVVQGDRIYRKEGKGAIKNFSFPKTANPKDDPEAQAKTLYGLHSPVMCIIVEEAAGVLEPVFKPLEGTLTDAFNFIAMVFNPIYRTGFAIESHTGAFSHKWLAFQWDAEESELVTREHIATMEEKYGRNSNTFRTLVKGLPPNADDDTLIPYDWVQDAAKRQISPSDIDPHIGAVDPGAGGDNSVYTHRHGRKVYPQLKFSSPNSLEVAAWAVRLAIDDDLDALYFDIIGVGNGAYFEAKRLLQGSKCKVYSVDVRNKASNPDKYPNKRSELWFKARDVFQEGTISIPDDQVLKEELWSPKRVLGKKDEVEDKQKMKSRLGAHRSPNNADSLLLTFDKPDIIFRRQKEEEQHKAYRSRNSWPVQEEYGWMSA